MRPPFRFGGLSLSLGDFPFQGGGRAARLEPHRRQCRERGSLAGRPQEHLQLRLFVRARFAEQQRVHAALVGDQRDVRADTLGGGLDEGQVRRALHAPVVGVAADPVQNALAARQHHGRREARSGAHFDDVFGPDLHGAGRQARHRHGGQAQRRQDAGTDVAISRLRFHQSSVRESRPRSNPSARMASRRWAASKGLVVYSQ